MSLPISNDVFSSPSWLNTYWQLLVGIITLVAFIGWVVGFRPKASRIEQISYIDGQSKDLIESKTFSINWGRVFFFRKIALEEIDRNAKFKMLCKASIGGGMWTDLPDDYYGDYSADSKSRNVYLKNKNFYRKQKITEVTVETTKTAPSDFNENIEIKILTDKIEILNNNKIEIRNYPLELPNTITPDKFLAYAAYFRNWETRGGNRPTIAYLSPLEKCEGGKPGKKIIPIT